MRALTVYAYLNALIRSKVSRILDGHALAALAAVSDPAGLSALLRETDYRPLSAAIDAGVPLTRLEKLLVEIEISRYREVLRHTKGAVRRFVSLLMERYELDKVEGLFRLWMEKAWEEREGIIEETICRPVPVDEILKASSVEEIILLLEKTPWRAPLGEAYERYRKSGRLNDLEAAMETDYHRRLWAAVGGLSRTDRAAASRFLGLETDIRNLEFLCRLRRYTSLPAADARRLLLPGGPRSSERLLVEAYASGDGAAAETAAGLAVLPRGTALPPGGDALARLRFLAVILEESLDREARRALAGDPFTIATAIAYVTLRRLEAKRIRRALIAASLDIPLQRQAPAAAAAAAEGA